MTKIYSSAQRVLI
jgi:hypothetical protein